MKNKEPVGKENSVWKRIDSSCYGWCQVQDSEFARNGCEHMETLLGRCRIVQIRTLPVSLKSGLWSSKVSNVQCRKSIVQGYCTWHKSKSLRYYYLWKSTAWLSLEMLLVKVAGTQLLPCAGRLSCCPGYDRDKDVARMNKGLSQLLKTVIWHHRDKIVHERYKNNH